MNWFTTHETLLTRVISKQLWQLCHGVWWPKISAYVLVTINKALVITSQEKLCGWKRGQSFSFHKTFLALKTLPAVNITLKLGCKSKNKTKKFQLFFFFFYKTAWDHSEPYFLAAYCRPLRANNALAIRTSMQTTRAKGPQLLPDMSYSDARTT